MIYSFGNNVIIGSSTTVPSFNAEYILMSEYKSLSIISGIFTGVSSKEIIYTYDSEITIGNGGIPQFTC